MLKKLYMDLDERAKIIIITAVIVSVAFFICFKVTKQRVSKSYDMRLKITEERKKFLLRSDIGSIENKQGEYFKYLYDTIDQEDFRLVVSGFANVSGVEIISVKPLGYKGIANITKNLLKISLRCTYSQLVEFIANIERLPEIMKIEELSVTGLADFKSYTTGDEDAKKKLMESVTKANVSLIVAAYSTKH